MQCAPDSVSLFQVIRSILKLTHVTWIKYNLYVSNYTHSDRLGWNAQTGQYRIISFCLRNKFSMTGELLAPVVKTLVILYYKIFGINISIKMWTVEGISGHLTTKLHFWHQKRLHQKLGYFCFDPLPPDQNVLIFNYKKIRFSSWPPPSF